MKMIKKYNRFIKESRLNREYIESETLEFIEKISNLISINWDIYDIDYDHIDSVVSKHLDKIEQIELISADLTKTDTEYLVVKILNVGYSVGFLSGNILKYNSIKFDFEKFFEDISENLKIDEINNKKLNYSGPDITSSSILAGTYNIKDSIKSIKKDIDRRYSGYDGPIPEYPEVTIILGKVYQYGYGAGHDIGYVDYTSKMSAITIRLNSGDISAEEEWLKMISNDDE